MKHLIYVASGLLGGALLSIFLLFFTPFISHHTFSLPIPGITSSKPKQVIGFLPYWLLDKADQDYSQNITTLTYFALRIDTDGTIVNLANTTQDEPGWYALKSGKVTPFLDQAKAHHVALSLALDSGDVRAINAFISNPTTSAQNLTKSVLPLFTKYGFSDLNIDVEYTATASPEAKIHFTQFVKEIRKELPSNITITLEISPIDALEENNLIDIKGLAPYTTYFVIMTYDYHATDSFVTGPVAPLHGAGIMSEYDVTSAVVKTLQFIHPQQLILGIPLYGYEWETLGEVPRSAIIPGSGVVASTQRLSKLLNSCATCSAQLDKDAGESYLSYFNTDTNSTHILFFPTQQSTKAKINFANTAQLGGLALWALGYEDINKLTPISSYKIIK